MNKEDILKYRRLGEDTRAQLKERIFKDENMISAVNSLHSATLREET